jgi:hypothetical protein
MVFYRREQSNSLLSLDDNFDHQLNSSQRPIDWSINLRTPDPDPVVLSGISQMANLPTDKFLSLNLILVEGFNKQQAYVIIVNKSCLQHSLSKIIQCDSLFTFLSC